MRVFPLPHFLKTVQPEVSCLRSSTAQRTMVDHGRVCTYGPSPHNPYTIQLFKVLHTSSFCPFKRW